MTQLRIQVTQSDIDTGIRSDIRACPVARAIARMGFSEVRVFVDGVYAVAPGGNTRRHYYTSHIVREWLDSYDTGSDAAPASFVLVEART